MATPETAEQFEHWVDHFDHWVGRVDYPRHLLGDFKLEPKYADPPVATVEFGKYKGAKKWQQPEDHPDPEGHELLLKLVTIQGDTEFASVEQQAHLLETAPSAYDLKSAVRVNVEEMRHGWQMSHVLITAFGTDGQREAEGLLQRNAQEGERILQAFNDPVRNWLDFFCYTAFLDRDGKFQLGCLLHSGYFPLSASMGPMLKEEAFHLGTGVTGIMRILAAGKVPIDILQRRINWWVSTSLDCFGGEQSRKARKVYDLGLKGRYDEGESNPGVEVEHVNEYNQGLYHEEVTQIVDRFNAHRASGTPPLVMPSQKFRRRVGLYKDQCFALDGTSVKQDRYDEYLNSNLPTKEDDERLEEIFKEEWIAPRGA